MTYLGAMSMDDITRSLARGSGVSDRPFSWDSKYLPVVVGFAGVSAAFIIAGIVKKRKKKRSKK